MSKKKRYTIRWLHVPRLLLVALAAMNSQNNLLFWVFAVCFSGLMISGIVSGVMMLGVHVRRVCVSSVQVVVAVPADVVPRQAKFAG
jgi:hypothetical protein